MSEPLFPCIGWAFGSNLSFDRLASEFRFGQALALAVLITGASLLYSALKERRGLGRQLARSKRARLGCNRLLDASLLQEGSEVTVHTLGKSGGANLDARIGAVRRGILEIWIDCDASDNALSVGAPVELWQPSPAGGLQCQAVIVDKRVEPNGVTLMVNRPTWLANFQRRRFRRFSVLIPATVTIVHGANQEGGVRRGLIEDLSGGGFRLSTAKQIPPGAIVHVSFAGPENIDSRFEARVLNCGEHARHGENACYIQFEFMSLNEKARASIIDYCVSVKVARKSRFGGKTANGSA